jgi:predicted Rdx family selenoprotein
MSNGVIKNLRNSGDDNYLYILYCCECDKIVRARVINKELICCECGFSI